MVEPTNDLEGHQRNITWSFDEIKIQEDLVFDKNTVELISFVDHGDHDGVGTRDVWNCNPSSNLELQNGKCHLPLLPWVTCTNT